MAIVDEEKRKQLELERQRMELEYKQLEDNALKRLGFSSCGGVTYYDKYIIVKSRQALENYDDIKFFKENKEELKRAEGVIERKRTKQILSENFLQTMSSKLTRNTIGLYNNYQRI